MSAAMHTRMMAGGNMSLGANMALNADMRMNMLTRMNMTIRTSMNGIMRTAMKMNTRLSGTKNRTMNPRETPVPLRPPGLASRSGQVPACPAI